MVNAGFGASVDGAGTSRGAAAPSGGPAQQVKAADGSTAPAGRGAGEAGGGRNAAPSSGLAAARAAAAGARNAAAARAAGKPAVNPAWSDGSPTEEAPYDPEFDGPPSAGKTPKFEGFDPGDEPLDVVIDEKTARESGEQQAMRLLQEAFGAEKIGEA